jgi:peptidoglycan-associated lipoprotein
MKMIQSEKMSAWRLAAVALSCIMLGACSTTQKSSTVTGSPEAEQVAAPVAEAGASPSASSAPATATAPSTTAPDAQELPVFPETRATPIESEEAQVARQQLAEQDAQITRLREEQAASRQLTEEGTAQQRELETAAAAQAQSAQPGTASSARPSGASPGAGAATAGTDASAIGRPAQTSVYFGFDEVTVSQEYDAVVTANAAFLKANPGFTVTVQGNCDERGSREYNLALGARRAEMVKRALELSGVDGDRISTVSFGAEKPVASGKDEESYRLNRRADIVY